MSDYEPLSPVAVETKLRSLVTELTRAQQKLAESRDLEVGAEIVYQRARDAAFEVAPQVRRGEYTVAEREQHVDGATRETWERWRRAETARKNAEDHLRTVRDQASLVQSLARSVGTAYGLAGVSA